MAVKGNDDHTPTGKEGHITDDGQIVGVDVQLELRLKIKRIFMQVTSVNAVISRHALNLRRIQNQATGRLGDIGKADACKSRQILGGRLTVGILLLCDGFWAHRPAIITHSSKAAFHQRSFAISCQFSVEEKQTFIAGISADAVAEGLLQESSLFTVVAHDFINKGIETLRVC